jgi:hypothetical protein
MQAKALWAEIRSLHDPNVGGCYASEEYLCEFMQLKRRRLYELFSDLKAVGLMETISFDGRRTVRRAIVPNVEYEGAQQQCGKAHSSSAEKRTPGEHKSALPSYIENKEKNKDKKYPLPPKGEAAIAARERVRSSSSSANEKATPPASARKETPEDAKDSLGEHGNCHLTAEEQRKLKEKFGQAGFDSWVETIDLEAEKKGVAQFMRKYKSHYATILSWYRMRKEKAGPESDVAYHRKNSKLAFQTSKDDWVPTPIAPSELSADQRAAIMEELRFKS